jgi:membrane protease YdiL (CAAX protease family)
MEYAALTVALAICLYSGISGKIQYREFKQAKTTPQRIKFFRRWIIEPWFSFGLFSVVALLLLEKAEFLYKPIVGSGFSSFIPASVRQDPGGTSAFFIGLAMGVVILIIRVVLRARKTMQSKLKGTEKFNALLPQNSRERPLSLALAVSAGVNEELFFRAALPLILFVVLDNKALALAISVIIFGLVHFYQGWKGVLVTGIMGWVLLKVFLFSGNILVPMAVHSFIDIMSLVLIPLLAEKSANSAKRQKSA